MSNVLVAIISTFSYKREEKEYKICIEDCKNPIVKAYHTNESIFKGLVSLESVKKSNGIDKIIALVSNKANSVKNQDYQNKTAFQYYKDIVNEISPKTNIIQIFTEDDREQSVNISGIIDLICKNITSNDVVYLDGAGGRRTTNNVIQLLAKLLRYKGIKNPFTLYADINNSENYISDTSDFESMTDLADGFNEFITSGNSLQLNRYFSKNETYPEYHELLEYMNDFSDNIRLGRVDSLGQIIESIDKCIKKCEKIEFSDKEKIGTVILNQFLPLIKQKLIGDSEKQELRYIKLVKWCLENTLIQQALTIFVEKVPVDIFNSGIIKYLGDIQQEKRDYSKAKKASLDSMEWETQVFYTDLLDINNPEYDELYNHLTNNTAISDEKVKEIVTIINTVINKWDNLKSLESKSQYIELIDYINQNKFTSAEKFKNAIIGNKKLLYKLLKIPEIQNTYSQKFASIELLKSKQLKEPFKCKISIDNLVEIYYGYVYVKMLRNKINHASSEEIMSLEHKQILSKQGYNCDDFSILAVSKNLNKAIQSIEKGSWMINGKQDIKKQDVPETYFTELQVGDCIEATCIRNKIVRIKSYDYDINLVIPAYKEPEDYLDKTFEVVIKQISKIGKINQVGVKI